VDIAQALETLSEQNDKATLVELATQIETRSAELAEGDMSPEVAAELETLADSYEAVNGRLVEIETVEGELKARADEALLRITGDIEEAAVEEAPEAEAAAEETEVVAEEVEVEEVAVEETIEIETPAAAAAEAVAAIEVVEEAAAAPKPKAKALAAALTARQATKAPETKVEVPETSTNPLGNVQLAATNLAGADFTPGTSMDLKSIAKAISTKRGRMGVVPAGVHDERITVATAEMPWDAASFSSGVSASLQEGSEESNFLTLRETQQQATALVASGGPCSPFPPSYEIFRLAQPHDPVAQCLPSVGAPRGGIKWIVPPDFREARAGVGTVTCAEDEAGYGSGSGQATPKPCIQFDCPDTDECCVVAVSHCIRFGNLNFRTFPEWVESRTMDLMVEFTSVKEVLYLDVIDGESTPTTTDPLDGYGLSRRMFSDAVKAAAAYRKRNGMNVNAVLDWVVPSWVMDAAVVDLANDHSLGLEVLAGRITAEMYFRTLAANANLRLCVYYDSATGEGQAFSATQAGTPAAPGELNDWPEDAVTYLFSPGTFVRLDGGSLDVGLIRDSALNRTNDLEIFAEEWTQVCKIGIESIKITHQGLCPNGAAPEPDALIVCGS